MILSAMRSLLVSSGLMVQRHSGQVLLFLDHSSMHNLQYVCLEEIRGRGRYLPAQNTLGIGEDIGTDGTSKVLANLGGLGKLSF